MKITGNESEYEIIKELGLRIKRYRISLELTQRMVSEKTGVSLSTVARIENGEDATLSNYVKILNLFGLSQNIDLLLPQPQPDPRLMFKGRNMRKRIRGKVKKESVNWVWGEDK